MNQGHEKAAAGNQEPQDIEGFKHPRWVFLAWSVLLILAAVLSISAILLYPSQPEIPSYRDLKSTQGIFTYQPKTNSKKGTYYIGEQALECPEAIRLYPFPSCSITIEIKAAEQKIAKAYWYSHSFMGFPYAMMVELIVDKNNNYLNLQGIKVLEYAASKEIIEKLHLQRKAIYQYTFTLLGALFILLVLLLILAMYFQRKYPDRSYATHFSTLTKNERLQKLAAHLERYLNFFKK